MFNEVTEKTRTRKRKRSARQIIAVCLALVMFFGSAFAFEPAAAFSQQRNLTLDNLELEWEHDLDLDWGRTAPPANYAELVDLSHWQVEENELTELPPDVLAELLREQEAYFTQNLCTNESAATIDEWYDIFNNEIDYNAYQEIIAMSAVDHENIVSRPFALRFDANDSVALNTGASRYRINVLNIPGRNGFDLNLDLIYDSSRAYISDYGGRFRAHGLFSSLGIGWIFDLPYILNNMLYVPGRGSFRINRHTNQIMDRVLRDMTLSDGPRGLRQLTFFDGTIYLFLGGDIYQKTDRFGNTIRFEHVSGRLSRIIDTNGNVITFTYDSTPASGGQPSSRTVTITDHNGSAFVINMGQIPHHFGRYEITSVQNQVGAVTTFLYNRNSFWFHLTRKDPTYFEARLNRVSLLAHVIYPSGAQVSFEYSRHNINFNRTGSRQKYKVSARVLRSSGREYNRTTFFYDGCYTAFPQVTTGPDWGYTYRTIVTQNNGLWTIYAFDHRHLNFDQLTYNAQGQLLFRQFTAHGGNKLPQFILTTTFRNNMVGPTNRTDFTYNHFGQITRIVSPLSQGSTHERYRTDYTYDLRFGLPLTRTSRPDAQTTVVERNTLSDDGRRIIRSYVYENDVRRKRTDFFHDAFGNVTEIREFFANNETSFVQTQITYESGTRPSRIRRTGVRDANGTLVGNIDRHFTYDPMWRVLTETDPNGYVTRFGYDRIGRITRIDFPNGGFVTYAYDDRQNTLTHRTVLGAVYTYQYDGFGNLIAISVDGREILRNVYDNRKRVVLTQNAQGIDSTQRTTFVYDILDRVIERRSVSPTGEILYRETIQFNDLVDSFSGNRMVTTTVVGTGTLATGAAPNIQTFVVYDRFGRRIQEGFAGLIALTSYTHDLAGRIITEHSFRGVNNTFTYNIHGVTSVRNIFGDTAYNTYDMLGRVVTSTDFMGNVQRFTYDTLGRLLTHRVPFERSGTITRYAETRYFYDRNGNLTRQSNLVNIPGQAQIWATTENTFRHNRLMSSQTGGVNGIRTEYTYNLAGNVLTKTVGGATTRFAYNNRGQLISTTDALGQTETFAYDANGHLITHIDRNGTTFQMSYDNLGRMTRKEARQNGVLVGFRSYSFHPTGAVRQVDNGSHVITYYYDTVGLVRRQTETGGIVKTFVYNFANNLTQSRVYVDNVLRSNNEYTFDTAQRVQTVRANGELIATYTYNANNQRTSTVSSNNLTTTYTHNLAGLVTNVTNRRGTATLSSFAYLYYLDGNTRQVTENLSGVSRTITYTYDLARRLTRENVTGTGARTEVFAFDNRGNRTSRTVTGSENYTVTYAYDLNNRLLTSTKTPTGGSAEVTTFSYDNNGNQLTKTVSGVTETKTYNAFNQLISVSTSGVEIPVITNVAVNVTSPIVGATPNRVATGTGNFTIGQVTWSPNHNVFAENTRYTASVTLATNATFADLQTATINGNPATITNNTGNAVTLSYQFPETFVAPASKLPIIAAGASHSVSVRYDGTVWAWGSNSWGQLGDNTTTVRHVPVQTQNLTDITAVTAGSGHTAALRADGTVWSWGSNSQGQLGDGTTTARRTAVQVQNLTNVTDISAGVLHTAALRGDGTVWTWGNNGSGVLGDGTTTTRHMPVQVQNLTNVVAVSAGTQHTVALRADGTVWTWGNNGNGRLGDGTVTARHTPVQVEDLTNVIEVSAGGSHTVALRSNGTVWAWGNNAQGQLGDGTTIARSTPVQVQGLTNVIAISAGSNHTIALRDDGVVIAWGSNINGQLGDGTTTARLIPVQVRNIANIIEVAAGCQHNIALRDDGSVFTWGSNNGNQLGDPVVHTWHGIRTPIQTWGANGYGFLNLKVSLPVSSDPSPRAVLIDSWGWCGELSNCSDSRQLNAIVFPLSGNQNVVWKSSYPDGISVTQSGVVYVVGDPYCCCASSWAKGVTIIAIAENGVEGFFSVWLSIRRSLEDELELSSQEESLLNSSRLEFLDYECYSECYNDCVHEYEIAISSSRIIDIRDAIYEYLNGSVYECCCEMDIQAATTFDHYIYDMYDRYDIWENQFDVYYDGDQLAVMIDEEAAVDAYIAFNQLTSSLVPGMMAIYTYRADGLRHSKTVNGASTRHVWLGNSIVLELDGSGAIINRFDRSLTGRLIRSDNHGFYLYNKRGDVVQRVNAQGQVIRNYRYTAFGVELNPDEQNSNPFRFAGEYWDAETGTYYLRARSFNPRLGRFTQQDWHWNIHNFKNCNWSILQAGNLYVFTMNNPIKFIDPLGLYAVIARYIARRNNGIMHETGRHNLETHRWEIDSITIRIGDMTRSFSAQDGTVTRQDGHWIIDSSHLMSAFGLTQEQATHQSWDRFDSMDTAAIAFSLMHTQRSTDMGREIGAIIYSVTGTGQYTFGKTWVGGERDVIAGFVMRLGVAERRRASYAIVALAHTHPPNSNWFSLWDMRIAHGTLNILEVGVPTMPVFMSVNMDSGRMEVRRYDNTMNWNPWGRLIFAR